MNSRKENGTSCKNKEPDLDSGGRHGPFRAIRPQRDSDPGRREINENCSDGDAACSENVDNPNGGERFGSPAQRYLNEKTGGNQGNEEHREREDRVVRIVKPGRVYIYRFDHLRRSEHEENGRSPERSEDGSANLRSPWIAHWQCQSVHSSILRQCDRIVKGRCGRAGSNCSHSS